MRPRLFRALVPLLLAVCLPVSIGAARAPASKHARHDVQLALLDSYLARGDDLAAADLVRRLEPELDKDERFALDTLYCFLRRGKVQEARAQWNRVAPRLQQSLQTALAKPGTPAAEQEVKRRAAEALFVQGLLMAHDGQKEEALRLLRQADGYGFPPLDSPLMVLAANSLFQLQEHALATQAYREVLKRTPENAQARLRLAVSLYSSGQLAGAQQELERVLQKDARYPQAHYYFGAVLFEQKRSDEAKAQLEKELALDARCVGCMAKLAHIAYLKGDDRQCESWLAQAAALDPDYVETNLVSGMLENRTGRYDRAIRHLSRVVERSPGYTKAQYQLALAYKRSGNAEKAREHLEIYSRLIQDQKAKSLGVRGSEED